MTLLLIAGESHVRESHVPPAPPYTCALCRFSGDATLSAFFDAASLVKHLTSHVVMVTGLMSLGNASGI